MYNNCFPPCPPPCPPKKKDGCFFGKVEQKNVNEQNATIVQTSTQKNFFLAKCGCCDDKKKPAPWD